MKRSSLYLILVVLFGTGFYMKFRKNHQDIPGRCDEFGYMNLAKAFDEHKAFGDHASRPYLSRLLKSLRTSGITEDEIDWMVVPYAYYVIPGTDRVINQYPPGTSWLLSWFPLPVRRMMFPAVAAVLLLAFPFLAARKVHGETVSWLDAGFVLTVLFMSVSIPFLTEFARINSVAFGFGLLIAAGLTLEKKPLLSCFLIALTLNFRPVNVMVLLPLLAYMPFAEALKNKTFLPMLLKYAGVFLLAVMPYLIYAYLLLGHPLASTYSPVDTGFGNNLSGNMAFYFSLSQPWFIFHLVLLAILFLLTRRRKKGMGPFYKSLLFPLVNYFFYIGHDEYMNYYPYASAMILLGLVLSGLADIPVAQRQMKTVSFICVLAGVVSFADGLFTSLTNNVRSFEDAKKDFAVLCGYDIVWGELLPGSSEYVCGNNGFRYAPSTPRARIKTMQFLHNEKYRQAILLDDNKVNRQTVIAEVQSCDVAYRIINDQHLGSILVIE